MRTSIYRAVFMLFILLCCTMSCNKKTSEEAPQNVLGIQSYKVPAYSSATLRGTEWVADYSCKDDEYRICFTDSLYICTEILLGKTWEYKYPYYVSETPDRVFDKARVGKENVGNYFISYSTYRGRSDVEAIEIYYVSPEKLVLVKWKNDTVSYTRYK